jgi:hypothetical protein
MKVLLIGFAICSIAACKSVTENHSSTKETAKPSVPVVVTENNVPYLIATGFEPMWTLNLSTAQDGTYPVTFTTITEEMTGTLRMVTDRTFEGMVKSQSKETLLKVVIADIPCQREDGETKDPQTVTITYDKNTVSGCRRKP